MGFELTARDEEILSDVHPDLQMVIRRAAQIAPFRFRVLEGVRSIDRQRELVASGASRTMNSRHLTGHAVDIAPYFDNDGDGDIDGADMWHWPLYHRLAPIVKQAAQDVRVRVEWGGDWRTFKDGPHWQLPWRDYPLTGSAQHASAAQAMDDPPATEPVERPRTHAAVVATTGATATAAVVEPAIPAVIDALTDQQANLTSGDWARIAFGLVLVGLAVYAIRTR